MTKKLKNYLLNQKYRFTFASAFTDIFLEKARRGARVVMEQIANLSSGNRCQGSSPCLSALEILGV